MDIATSPPIVPTTVSMGRNCSCGPNRLYVCSALCHTDLLTVLQELGNADMYTPPHCLHYESGGKKPWLNFRTTSKNGPEIHVHNHLERSSEHQTRTIHVRTPAHRVRPVHLYSTPSPVPTYVHLDYPTIQDHLLSLQRLYPWEQFTGYVKKLQRVGLLTIDDISIVTEDAAYLFTGIRPDHIQIIFDEAERRILSINRGTSGTERDGPWPLRRLQRKDWCSDDDDRDSTRVGPRVAEVGTLAGGLDASSSEASGSGSSNQPAVTVGTLYRTCPGNMPSRSNSVIFITDSENEDSEMDLDQYYPYETDSEV